MNGVMTDSEFSELRSYTEASGSCIDMGYRPSASLIRKAWLSEIINGCWAITEKGRKAFDAVIAGTVELSPDGRDT